MSRSVAWTASFAIAVALAAPAHAQDCVWVTNPEVNLLDAIYLDNDACQPGCIASTWIYEESNGISGLQRQDAIVDDTCGGWIPGDTLVLGVLQWTRARKRYLSSSRTTPSRRAGRSTRCTAQPR